MTSLVYLVAPDMTGWRVTLDRTCLGWFRTRAEAFRVAAEEVRRCNGTGGCALVNVCKDSPRSVGAVEPSRH